MRNSIQYPFGAEFPAQFLLCVKQSLGTSSGGKKSLPKAQFKAHKLQTSQSSIRKQLLSSSEFLFIWILLFVVHNIKILVYKFICSLKTDKSEARNPKLETISKLQIQMFKNSFTISVILIVEFVSDFDI